MDLSGPSEEAVEALATPHIAISDHNTQHNGGGDADEFNLSEGNHPHHHGLVDESEGLTGFAEEEDAGEENDEGMEMSTVDGDFPDQHGDLDPASAFEGSLSGRAPRGYHSSSRASSSGHRDNGVNGRSSKKEAPIKPMAAHVGKSCNCKNTKCLKLYCECFAAGEYCKEYGSLFVFCHTPCLFFIGFLFVGRVCRSCCCQDCSNTSDFDSTRKNAIFATLQRNPSAFKPKLHNAPFRLAKKPINRVCLSLLSLLLDLGS